MPRPESCEPLPHVLRPLLAHPTGTPNQTRHPCSPQGVEALHAARSAVGLVRDPMLPSGKEVAVHQEAIGVNQLLFVVAGRRLPQPLKTACAPVAQRRRKNLPASSCSDYPQPQRGRHLHTKFVYLNRFPTSGGNNRLLRQIYCGTCPFLRTRRTVSRLIFSARAMPRCEVRSQSIRSTAASFSGVRARDFGWGVNVLLQAPQRRRRLPLSLEPNLTTFSFSPQYTQAIATIQTLYGINRKKANAL